MPASVPEVLAAWMRPFRGYFTAAARRHALVLVAGAVLAPGRRTVTAALRVMGLGQAPGFAVHHRVPARHAGPPAPSRTGSCCWSSRPSCRGPVVGLDDTIERRWGSRNVARGIYRDPVRSSRGHLAKASGLCWLCVMLLAPVPWAGCVWSLPFLTMLTPSERSARLSPSPRTTRPRRKSRLICSTVSSLPSAGWPLWCKGCHEQTWAIRNGGRARDPTRASGERPCKPGASRHRADGM